jgi:hypothetical protein
MFNAQELQTIAALINRASITGQEATTVAILLQKIAGLITPTPVEKPEEAK